MGVVRVERTKDYTVMSNNHLRNRDLSLKSKGLLSLVFSLPDEWDYSIRGLAAICREGVDAISTALKELETAGYIVRNQLRGKDGRIMDTEYVIYERPQPRQKPSSPDAASPHTENPYLDDSDMDVSDTENPAQLNTNQSSKEKISKDEAITHSIPFRSGDVAASPSESNRTETMLGEYSAYRDIVRENISYGILRQDMQSSTDQLDEVVELMVETICSTKKSIRVAGNDFPHEVVKSRLLKLDSEHIRFVFDCLSQNTSKVRNIKQYLLATLFNAPTTIGNYYSSLINHDLYSGES